MTSQPPKPARIVRFPTDEEMKSAFEEYTNAVGKVAYAWNFLHERLALCFAAIVQGPPAIPLAIWYSTENDRAQRKMLHAAVKASDANTWATEEQRGDVLWLLGKADSLSVSRNDAVHAPCSITVGHRDDDRAEMAPAFMNGHPRSTRLVLTGTRILDECAWCEGYAEILARYAMQIETALKFSKQYAWPARPRLPTKGRSNGRA